MNEFYGLFLNCYPDIVASENHVKEVFSDPQNVVLERRDREELIAALILKGNTILFLGVRDDFRGRGIGTGLLAEAEALLLGLGMDEIRLFGAASQVMPGAPLYEGVKEFFEKRGYCQRAEDGDFQELSLELDGEDCLSEVGETDDVKYRWGLPEDREATVNCAGEAKQRYEEIYWDERLYLPESKIKVLIAEPTRLLQAESDDNANNVCATLMVDMRESAGKIGGMGFASVKPAWAGQGIAVNLVRRAVAELKSRGFHRAYARCVSAEAAYLYEQCGFKRGMHYFRGRKKLDGTEIARQREMEKEIYIQYRELEGRMDQIEQRILDQFCQQGHQLSEIEKLQIYVKPQDFTAYYMINGTIGGKVGIF